MNQKIGVIGFFAAALFSAALFWGLSAIAAPYTAQVHVHSYATTNVTTGAYVQLVAAAPISCAKLEICDTSGKLLKLATGAAGSERDIATVAANACIVVPYFVPVGTRISIEAIDASATTGYNLLSFVP